jgi:DNA-binding PadR family transcriptional regulator
MDLPSAKEARVLELLLRQREMYGLEMVNAGVGLKRGTIYVTLGRMEDAKWISARTMKDEHASGLPRRLYRITGLGQRALAAREAAQSVLAGRPVPAGA